VVLANGAHEGRRRAAELLRQRPRGPGAARIAAVSRRAPASFRGQHHECARPLALARGSEGTSCTSADGRRERAGRPANRPPPRGDQNEIAKRANIPASFSKPANARRSATSPRKPPRRHPPLPPKACPRRSACLVREACRKAPGRRCRPMPAKRPPVSGPRGDPARQHGRAKRRVSPPAIPARCPCQRSRSWKSSRSPRPWRSPPGGSGGRERQPLPRATARHLIRCQDEHETPSRERGAAQGRFMAFAGFLREVAGRASAPAVAAWPNDRHALFARLVLPRSR